MSVLLRVEETYLGILRFIVILTSSLLLVAAVVLGVSAMGGLQHDSKREPEKAIAVKPDDVIGAVSAPNVEQRNESKGLNKTPQDKKGNSATDPNRAYYERTSAAVVGFVTKYGKGVESATPENVIEVSKSKAERYKVDPSLVTSFASGLAITMERALTSPAIIARVQKAGAAQIPVRPPTAAASDEEPEDANPPPAEAPFKESPLQVINELLTTYSEMFDEQIKRAEAEKDAAENDEAIRKTEAMSRLYMAGGAFGSFLALVFMSILVKIERNLRGLKVQQATID